MPGPCEHFDANAPFSYPLGKTASFWNVQTKARGRGFPGDHDALIRSSAIRAPVSTRPQKRPLIR
jgi:hypothetical protein